MLKLGFKIWFFLFLLLLVISISLLYANSADKDLFVHFIDVGYGDSILIEFPDGKNMLIDGGTKRNADKLINYLKRSKIQKINFILITHPDADHIGGLSTVVKRYNFDTIMSYADISTSEDYVFFFKLVKDKLVEFRKIIRDDEIKISDSIYLEVLHPDKLRESWNDSSIVAKLTYRRVSFLFTADIGPEICNELINVYGKRLKSNILKAPWHGKTKSKDFILAVEPQLVVISVGPYKWPGPRKEVLQDYKELNVPVLRTDEVGSIVVRTDGNEFLVTTEQRCVY